MQQLTPHPFKYDTNYPLKHNQLASIKHNYGFNQKTAQHTEEKHNTLRHDFYPGTQLGKPVSNGA
jgi:hypothetical protein